MCDLAKTCRKSLDFSRLPAHSTIFSSLVYKEQYLGSQQINCKLDIGRVDKHITLCVNDHVF